MSSPTLRRVEAQGLRFAYLDQGQGPLVMMVHGFPDTAHGFEQLQPAVAAKGYRVVAPFTRGYAPTEVPADGAYDVQKLGGDLIALVEALGYERAVVLGHDWGAAAAYAAAALAPDRVRLLLPMAIPHPAVFRPSLPLLWGFRHFVNLGLPGGAARLRRNDFAYLDELVRRWSPAWKDIPPAETAAVKACFADPASLDAAVGYYRAALGVGVPDAFREAISVPTAVFAGLNDPLPTGPYHAARRFFTDHYEVVEVPGGHFMHREHPEPFQAALLDVLDRLAPPG